MKKNLGPLNCLYPMPTVLVGALVNGKPNYITIAYVGILDTNLISISSHRDHFTNAGIKEAHTFSVNVPSEGLVKETDYCGLVSGREADKAALFANFYGVLKTAPMIAGCPVCMECKLIQTLNFKTHEVFIGEIVAAHVEESVLTDGVVDLAKVKPMLFDMPQRRYWRLGEAFAKCFEVGKAMGK